LGHPFSGIGVRAVGYHAAMSPAQRDKAHKDFTNEKASTCVATIAFGMGIDKRDVRKVIHYGCKPLIIIYCILFYFDLFQPQGILRATTRRLDVPDVMDFQANASFSTSQAT
jgi:hypothetical protein